MNGVTIRIYYGIFHYDDEYNIMDTDWDSYIIQCGDTGDNDGPRGRLKQAWKKIS